MIVKIEVDKEGPVPPKRVNKRCPAIILAARRIAKVPGRIIFLVVSIKTMNGIRIGEVPWGTKWANILFLLFNHPKIIKVIHNGKDRDNVITICLDLVNT